MACQDAAEARANAPYRSAVAAGVPRSQPCSGIKGTCVGSPPQAIDSCTPSLLGVLRGEAREAAGADGFPQDTPVPAAASSPCALHGRGSGFLYKTPIPDTFVSKPLQRARGCWKLWLQAASGEAGVGMMPLACASLPGRNITSCCQIDFILPL